MAYAIAMAVKCATARCPRSAKFTVHTQDGSAVAQYCEPCADREVARLTFQEQALRKERTRAPGV